MKTMIGIFDAKTRLAELCDKVAETGVEYVITRRGRPLARIVPPVPEPAKQLGVLARLRQIDEEFGPLARDAEEFPDVWDGRQGSKANPLESEQAPRP